VDEFEYTSPVGSFAANQNGLYDMGENVSQWCEDWTGAKREFRTLRGGDYIAAGEPFLRSSRRWGGHPSDRCNQDGFRCVFVVSGGQGDRVLAIEIARTREFARKLPEKQTSKRAEINRRVLAKTTNTYKGRV
jgi:hypothetical protein